MSSRLRMFAGPNGSGKSTIKSVVPRHLLGIYINPDEIQATLRSDGRLDLGAFEVETSLEEIKDFFQTSPLLLKHQLHDIADHLQLNANQLFFPGASPNAYHASVLSDFIRHQLLKKGLSFTFETVMSSQDKVAFLKKARASGYRVYLYYVATEDSDINVSRVQARARTGGHNVPEEKIRQRYTRSLQLLTPAIRQTDRAYFFDNSGSWPIWLAEITDGHMLEVKIDGQLPRWFQTAVLDQMASQR